MASTDTPQEAHAEAQFMFIADLDTYSSEKPYYFDGPLQPHLEPKRTNLQYKPVQVLVRDARDDDFVPSLKINGFCLIKHDAAFEFGSNAVENKERLTTGYFKQINAIMAERFPGCKTFVFDYAIRRNEQGAPEDDEWWPGTFDLPDTPISKPHVDQTRERGIERIKQYLSKDEASQYFDGTWRMRIVNAWRPLRNIVQDAPLAYCDFRSVDRKDLVACDRVSSEYLGENYQLRYNPDQAWAYFKNQAPDEISLFMSYDSHPGDDAEFCAHASFQASFDGNVPPRESIEVRSIVITRI